VSTLEDVLQIGRLDDKSLRFGIDLALVRHEYDIDAHGAQAFGIGREGPGITIEILTRPELQSIDEDAHDGARGARLRDAYQLDVAFVQVAHRGHEDVVRLAPEPLAKGSDRMYEIHRNA